MDATGLIDQMAKVVPQNLSTAPAPYQGKIYELILSLRDKHHIEAVSFVELPFRSPQFLDQFFAANSAQFVHAGTLLFGEKSINYYSPREGFDPPKVAGYIANKFPKGTWIPEGSPDFILIKSPKIELSPPNGDLIAIPAETMGISYESTDTEPEDEEENYNSSSKQSSAVHSPKTTTLSNTESNDNDGTKSEDDSDSPSEPIKPSQKPPLPPLPKFILRLMKAEVTKGTLAFRASDVYELVTQVTDFQHLPKERVAGTLSILAEKGQIEEVGKGSSVYGTYSVKLYALKGQDIEKTKKFVVENLKAEYWDSTNRPPRARRPRNMKKEAKKNEKIPRKRKKSQSSSEDDQQSEEEEDEEEDQEQ